MTEGRIVSSANTEVERPRARTRTRTRSEAIISISRDEGGSPLRTQEWTEDKDKG